MLEPLSRILRARCPEGLAQRLVAWSGACSLQAPPRPYNLALSHQRRFLWFRVAKVGTRTIFNILKQNEEIPDFEFHSGIRYSPKAFSGYYKFAFVRNPWDRLVSCWQDKVVRTNIYHFPEDERERYQDFATFVDYVAGLDIEQCDRHIRAQSALIDLNAVDFIGRMEAFNEDLRQVMDRIGLARIELKPKNVNPSRVSYASFYNEQTIAKVAAIYRKDIQVFGYGDTGGPAL